MKNSSDARFYYRGSSEASIEVARPVLTFFNIVTVNGDYLFPNHQHLNYQLIFAKRGTYRCTLNDTSLALSPRDILLVKPGDWHEDYGRKGLCYHALDFDLIADHALRGIDIVFQAGVTATQQVLRGPNTEIWEIVERMQAEAARTDPFVAHLENALLLELFWNIIRALPRANLSSVLVQRSEQQAFSERLRRVFDNHLEKRLDAATMAALFKMSVRTLTTRCREIIGQPPMQAFMAHKINYAAKLLQLSSLPVKDVSYRLGFQNQYHFSRVFRRHCGTPPSAFRALPK